MKPLSKITMKEIRIQKALGTWPQGDIGCTFCGNSNPETLTVQKIGGYTVATMTPFDNVRYTCLPDAPCSCGAIDESRKRKR